MTLRLVLDLNPVPQARPRIVFQHGRGAKSTSYTPEGTKQFYADFRWLVRGAGVECPLEGPLRVAMRFWRQCRGSARGDLSNVLKAVEDAGNGVLWEDDRQIVDLSARFEQWGPKVNGRIELEIVQLAKIEEEAS